MLLSDNFTLEELTYSATAQARKISNNPPQCVIPNLEALCKHVLQPLRCYVGSPVYITSGYRSALLNKVVGGVSTSQHLLGQAADFVIPHYDMMKAFNYIKNFLEYDQLLYEYDRNGNRWIHVSYKREGKNRRHYINNYKA